MQVTFIVKLAVALINELSSKGYEIGNTYVTESYIDVEFAKDLSNYKTSIDTANSARGEYLKVTGTMCKENWCITEDSVVPVLKECRTGDFVTIVPDEDGGYFVEMTKNYNAEFNMEAVDKTALRAIALDILGGIIAL